MGFTATFRSLSIIVAIVIFSGCAQLSEKFIRKNEEEESSTKRYYAVRKYDVKPSLELYTKRYVFWKTWHGELLTVLNNDNHKRVVEAAEQTVSNLVDMKRMLAEPKAGELSVIIGEMDALKKRIKDERITGANGIRIRREWETLGRRIKRDFSYNDVEEYIAGEFGGRN